MTTTQEDRLGTLVRRALRWKLFSQGFGQMYRILAGVLLARLLSPHDYGVAGMVLIISGVVLAFSDLAFGAALIQRRSLTERDLSTVFWTGVAGGVLFTLIGFALAAPVARFYGEPRVKALFAVFSLTFLITALGATQRALLSREMNFRSLELRTMIGTFVGGSAGIAIAVAGYGPWAIVLQQVIAAVCSTVMLWFASAWRPRFVFSFKSLRSLGGFSANVLAQRLLYYAHENAGSVLIGRLLGAVALGTFTVAYNVILIPFSRICIPVAEILFPAFSRLQEERERVSEVWLRSFRLLGAISIAPLLGLAIVAPDFVDVVLGRRWHAAVPVIQILCWVGMQQAVQSLNAGVMMALDRSQTLLRYTIVFFLAHLTAFAVGTRWGVIGVASAYAISTTLVEPLFFWLTARAIAISPWSILRSLAGVVQASALMAIAVLGARFALVHVGSTPLERLLLLIPLGAAVYLSACAWRVPEVVAEVRDLRRRRREARAPVAAAPTVG
jgi:O-antigen/teichoic acid export membrane protein